MNLVEKRGSLEAAQDENGEFPRGTYLYWHKKEISPEDRSYLYEYQQGIASKRLSESYDS